MVTAQSKVKPSVWIKMTKFLREVRAEMRKVAWPNRKELIAYTSVVLVTVVIVSVYIGVVDVVLSELLNLLGRITG